MKRSHVYVHSQHVSCGSVLWCVAVCCRHCCRVRCNVCCSMCAPYHSLVASHDTSKAVCCSVLQCVEAWYSVLQCP